MKLPFKLDRGGRDYHLVKCPSDRKLPPEELAKRPWYLRLKTTWKKVGDAGQESLAIETAKRILQAERQGSHPLQELLEKTAYRKTLTLAKILDAWRDAGFPQPNGVPREPDQQLRHREVLARCDWFRDKNPNNITQKTLAEYHRHRQASRAVDLELNTLSCCCAWAIAEERIDRNPFANRPRFQRAEDVQHASQFQPRNDEELHRIAAHMIQSGSAGAAALTLFCAMTGLRINEAVALRWDAKQLSPTNAEPGARIQIADGERLAVKRSKGGINPAIRIHPALADFLAAWRAHCAIHTPDSPWYFPGRNPAEHLGEQYLTKALQKTAKELGLEGERTAHGLRAYFVSVQRSNGVSDAEIAVMLGQSSGPALIVSTYGEGAQIHGTRQYDWLPAAPQQPAWTLLHTASTPSNIIPISAAV